jgi:uncharacterized protein YbbC (DUF1343 family)
MPFRQFGAPWLDAETLAQRLNALTLPGLRFAPTSFTPTSSKHQDTECHGVRLTVTDRAKLDAFGSGVLIVNAVYRLDPDHFEWRVGHFDRLCGTTTIRTAIIAEDSLVTLRDRYAAECRVFEKARQKYLLYR